MYFVQAHPQLSQEEKTSVCKYLNCQKLSQEVCVEAVQNEFMPLRLIVQALFVQQLNTQHAFKECSESFRFTYSKEFSSSLSSSKCLNSKSQNLGDIFEDESIINKPLNCLLASDSTLQIDQEDELNVARKEYESTSFRLQNLEQELLSIKKSIHSKKLGKEIEQGCQKTRPNYGFEGRSFSKRRNISVGQVSSCIGSVNFSSQRKYAGRLLKIFRKVSLFGRAKLIKRHSVSGS